MNHRALIYLLPVAWLLLVYTEDVVGIKRRHAKHRSNRVQRATMVKTLVEGEQTVALVEDKHVAHIVGAFDNAAIVEDSSSNKQLIDAGGKRDDDMPEVPDWEEVTDLSSDLRKQLADDKAENAAAAAGAQKQPKKDKTVGQVAGLGKKQRRPAIQPIKLGDKQQRLRKKTRNARGSM